MSDAEHQHEAALRARRLLVALTLFGTVIEHPHDAMRASNSLTCEGRSLFDEDEIELFRSGDQIDLDLANACLTVEREMRDAEWAAMERLLATVPPGGTYDEVVHLPWPHRYLAFQDLREVGWVRDFDGYDEPREE